MKKKILQAKWSKLENKIEKTITAKYDRIKDWKMDPKGYFLIKIDKEEKLIKVAYCKFTKSFKDPIHQMLLEVVGNSAIEIVNTLISRNLISTLQHAADMGIELNKAEIALKYDFEYIQDSNLVIK